MRSISSQILMMGLLAERREEAEKSLPKGRRRQKAPLLLEETGRYLRALSGDTRWSAHTIASISNSLGGLARFMLARTGKSVLELRITDCTEEVILDWLREEVERAGNSARTRNLKLCHARDFLLFTCTDHPLHADPYIKVARIAPMKPEIPLKCLLSDQQLVAMARVAASMNKGLRNASMLALMAETGMRVGEVVAASVGNLDLTEGRPLIKAFGKGSKWRAIPLSEAAAKIMRGYMAEHHPDPEPKAPLFYSMRGGAKAPLTTRRVEGIISECAAMARKSDATIPEKVTPHALRRSKATMLYRSGVPIELVAALLGHSSPDTTAQYYARPSDGQMRSILEKGETLREWEGPGTVPREEEGALKRRARALIRKSGIRVGEP